MARSCLILSAVVVLGAQLCGAQGVRTRRQKLPTGSEVTLNPEVSSGSQGGKGSAKRCRLLLKLADEYYESKKWGDARRKVDAALTNAVTPELRDECKARQDLLQKQGQALLDEARRLEKADKFGPALREYRSVAAMFGNLPCARDARKALLRLKRDPAARAYADDKTAQAIERQAMRVIERHQRQRQRERARATTRPATTQPADANAPDEPTRVEIIRRLSPRDQVRVIDVLERVAHLYPTTPTGEAAFTDVEKLHEDEEFWSALQKARRRKRIEDLFRQAEALMDAGMTEPAIRKYRKLVRTYPDSPQARKAEVILEAAPSGE
ncbi:MAG: tetratricopeptide repeat protein [Phycisphaerae bacterium]